MKVRQIRSGQARENPSAPEITAGARQISSSAMLSEAAERLRTSGLSRLPVVENNDIIGTITDRDIADAVAEGNNPRTTPVKYGMKVDRDTARRTP